MLILKSEWSEGIGQLFWLQGHVYINAVIQFVIISINNLHRHFYVEGSTKWDVIKEGNCCKMLSTQSWLFFYNSTPHTCSALFLT